MRAWLPQHSAMTTVIGARQALGGRSWIDTTRYAWLALVSDRVRSAERVWTCVGRGLSAARGTGQV